jgi:hypothetical protein
MQGCDVLPQPCMTRQRPAREDEATYGPNITPCKAHGVLGIPVTDETGTPDGVGRFNFFTGGSIYWMPSTGPMMVRGVILEKWGEPGFETGALGCPVQDEYRFRTMNPNTDPMTVCLFQTAQSTIRRISSADTMCSISVFPCEKRWT